MDTNSYQNCSGYDSGPSQTSDIITKTIFGAKGYSKPDNICENLISQTLLILSIYYVYMKKSIKNK